MDIETRERLIGINPAALAQYNKRERKRAAAQRQLESFMDYHNSQKREQPPEPERFISYEEREFDRKLEYDAMIQAQRQAETERKAAESERLAAKYKAEREKERAEIERNIELNFITEFEAAGQEWR